jgi:Domain of unknown function (DUF4405)
MARRHKINLVAYVRAIVALVLIVVWSVAAFTGFLLWFAPTGYGAGRLPLFLGLTRHQWGDIHFVISVAALCVTLVHLIIDWRVLRGYLRYLISVHRSDLFK